MINVPVPRVRNARREVPGYQRAELPHRVSGHRGPMGTRRRPPTPEAEAWGFMLPICHEGAGSWRGGRPRSPVATAALCFAE